MVSGDAWSASVSISFDFEMSQFWQKRQARLHPAVPNEKTDEPGRKWLSGFFSMGSTQNARGATVGGQHDLAVDPPAHEAHTPLAVTQLARAWAEIALDTPVVEPVPVLRREGGWRLAAHNLTVVLRTAVATPGVHYGATVRGFNPNTVQLRLQRCSLGGCLVLDG